MVSAREQANYTITYELEYADASGDVDPANLDAYLAEIPGGAATASGELATLCANAFGDSGATAPFITIKPITEQAPATTPPTKATKNPNFASFRTAIRRLRQQKSRFQGP